MILGSGLGQIPTVFVSSTCYDLSQIRADIKEFFELQLGYEALLSEYNSFPLEPDLGTVDNCLRVVQERADIFVLVIGGRYGYVTDNGKSVTNMEYLRARAKGIPVYVFVHKPIINVMQLWKDNPNSNFESVVDSVKLFEFVNTLRGQENIWIHTFENAQDIEQTLRKQLSYLFGDCLKLRKMAQRLPKSSKVTTLSGQSFKIALEKPAGWEYKLFAQVLQDGLCKSADLRRDLKYGISFGNIKTITDGTEICELIQVKTNEILGDIATLNVLINQAMPEAFGADGVEGDIDHIIYAAEQMVKVYKYIIDWALAFKRIDVPSDWDKLIEIVSRIAISPLEDIEEFSQNFNIETSKIPAAIDDSTEPLTLKLTLVLNEPNLSEFYTELERLSQKYGIRSII